MDRNDEKIFPHIRRIQLPSGKEIEVVHFETAPSSREETRLHRCKGCGSRLVYPIQWSEADAEGWLVTLRCPECEAVREGVFGQSSVDALDDQLDAGTTALVADLRSLTRANMTEEGERFFAALAVDAILPEDF